MSSLENELGIFNRLGEPFIVFWDEALYDSPTTPWNVLEESIEAPTPQKQTSPYPPRHEGTRRRKIHESQQGSPAAKYCWSSIEGTGERPQAGSGSNLADVPSSPVESCQERRQKQQREVKSQARRKNVGKDLVFINSGPSDIQFIIAKK